MELVEGESQEKGVSTVQSCKWEPSVIGPCRGRCKWLNEVIEGSSALGAGRLACTGSWSRVRQQWTCALETRMCMGAGEGLGVRGLCRFACGNLAMQTWRGKKKATRPCGSKWAGLVAGHSDLCAAGLGLQMGLDENGIGLLMNQVSGPVWLENWASVWVRNGPWA